MTASQPPDLTASNKDPGCSDARAAALAGYLAWLDGRPLAARNRWVRRASPTVATRADAMLSG